jgi:hypothetical protein
MDTKSVCQHRVIDTLCVVVGGGGGMLHVDTFAHNTSGIAYQDTSRRPVGAINLVGVDVAVYIFVTGGRGGGLACQTRTFLLPSLPPLVDIGNHNQPLIHWSV